MWTARCFSVHVWCPHIEYLLFYCLMYGYTYVLSTGCPNSECPLLLSVSGWALLNKTHQFGISFFSGGIRLFLALFHHSKKKKIVMCCTILITLCIVYLYTIRFYRVFNFLQLLLVTLIFNLSTIWSWYNTLSILKKYLLTCFYVFQILRFQNFLETTRKKDFMDTQ